VITAAAAGIPSVRALVYVAAFAPDEGETLAGLLERPPRSEIGPALAPAGDGFVMIDRARFHDVFAKDVRTVEARVMAATQKPIASAIFEAPFAAPAWKGIPSHYLVAAADRAIHPDLQRFMAGRMKARTAEVDSSHVPFVSRPDAVARFILEAAARP
jgi:pimeloyl-ACP methyl ester carboxylesterase